MRFLHRLFHFLGSLPLAIFLIASAATIVIVGTLLESKTDSHRLAANFTYGSPLFTLLLSGFFINILFSSLRRWPFQWKHVPFLITHLGLLMVIAGAIIKTYFGIQGHMILLEGGSSSRVTLPHTESLFVEKRDPSLPPLEVETIRKHPNGLENRQSWISNGHLHLSGLSPFPVTQLDKKFEKIPIGSRVHFDEYHEFDLIAVKTLDWESTARAIYKQVLHNKEFRPALAWIQDDKDSIHFFAFDPWADVFESELNNDPEAIVVYDKGFGGYTVPLDVPIGHNADTEIPPIQLFVSTCKLHGLAPQEELDTFFTAWNPGDHWMMPPHTLLKESTKSVLKNIDWFRIPKHEYKVCLWGSRLFNKIDEGLAEGFSLQEVLQMANWPLKADSLKELLQQVYSIAPQLPDPSTEHFDPAQILSIYMRLYGVIPAKIMTLETPLMINYTEAEPLQKWEDNRSLITLKTGNEMFNLLFDKNGTDLKRPIQNGRYLIRYQPGGVDIPYRLRLRQARQINYPGTSQPYSYEADLLINELPVTLSMNNVHETSDGYRFYLASISPSDPGKVKQVQIVVNYDPIKYILTYPGAILLILGVLLLFYPSLLSSFLSYLTVAPSSFEK